MAETLDVLHIDSDYKQKVTAQLLENTETFGINHHDPLLTSLIRRVTPTLITHDIAGLQPMNGPNA